MPGDAGGRQELMGTRMYDPTTARLEQPRPSLVPERIITRPTPEQVANALGGPNLRQVLRILGGETMPPPRPAGPDTAWDAVGRTIANFLGRVPGQGRILGRKPERLNPLAGIAPDKFPAVASLPDSLNMVPRPPLREISPPPYDPGVVTRLVLPPGMEIEEVNGGPRVDLPLKAVVFRGGKNPNDVGREEPTKTGWERVYGLLPELGGRPIPTDSSPRGRAARHLASRLLQVEEAIDNGPGGREGLKRGPDGITPRASEAIFLLLTEMSLKNALEGLARGDPAPALDALRVERQGCEIIRENSNHRNITDAGLGKMRDWAGDRAHFLQLLEGEL